MPRQVEVQTMRTQIVLQTKTESTNELNETTWTWDDSVTLFAEAIPKRARDFIAATQEQLPVDVVFRVRWRAGITASTHRVKWRGDCYSIHAEPIDIDGRRQTLEIMGIKGLRDGS